MWRRSSRRYRPAMLIVVIGTWCCANPGQAADDGVGQHLLLPLGEDVTLLNERPQRARDFAIMARHGGAPSEPATLRGRRRPKLDLSPFIGEILGFLRRHGIP